MEGHSREVVAACDTCFHHAIELLWLGRLIKSARSVMWGFSTHFLQEQKIANAFPQPDSVIVPQHMAESADPTAVYKSPRFGVEISQDIAFFSSYNKRAPAGDRSLIQDKVAPGPSADMKRPS